jgi:NADPH:quinone reductase-like Zn-dependent oxidoreductase/acyl carrier protein
MMAELNKERIASELKAFIVRDLLAGDGAGLDDDTPLLEWGIIESFSLVRLVNHISQTFGVELPFSMITPKNFESVSAIAEAVSSAHGGAPAGASRAGRSGDERRALVQTTPGVLDAFGWRSIPRPAPVGDQVEIQVHAAGINFRDVMIALSLYPELPALPGRPGECAGTVSRVGPDAQGLECGDAVFAIVDGDEHGAFADYVLTAARLVAKKPANLSFAQAATLPIAFLTAHHALRILGRISAGERVLIHSAAGACGLAAVQLALAAGAEVFATVGIPSKATALAELGVKHVFDNRSLAFAEGVLAASGGRGVDIVLNSIPGPYLDKGLSLLAPFGRFIELGKTAIHANASIGLAPFRDNRSFFAVDLVPILRERRRAVGEFLLGLLAELRDGVARPLPHTVFPFEEAGEAFRRIAQRRNVGKMVLATSSSNSGAST